jgi:hypothetical protein
VPSGVETDGSVLDDGALLFTQEAKLVHIIKTASSNAIILLIFI